MFFKKYGDIIVGVFFMALSAIMMVMAKMLPKSKVMEIGPDFMPMVIGAITFVLALILTALNVKNMKMRTAELEGVTIDECDYKRVLLSALLVFIYVFVLQPVGFIVSTLVYLPLQMLVLSPDDQRGKKQIIQLLIIDVIFTMIVFFLFRYGFKIVLPAGIFTINL
ncbi:MAG: tripartite tricarboxylate transporter TctB family protein [Lachnospiraceae bacterium]|jgi:putative tricarboxylic transport membrane protein|nr:tripartite tricarboxylate transporter TctB family protein [Lachnospiraceae bacterium]